MKITNIESQKKDPTRKSIFVDGEFLLGISQETLVRYGLRTGDEIDNEQIVKLRGAEQNFAAKRAAFRFLSHRPRTIREVRNKLREREFGDDEINQTIADFEESGILDDREFARMYVRDAITLRPAGKLMLRQKLLLLGIDKLLVEEVLETEFHSDLQEEAAFEAASKFLRRLGSRRKNEEKLKLRNRTGNFLSRRGFTWDVISPVLKRVFDDNSAEEMDE